jgi:RNA polymerase sigma factor (sigma-70 family)
MGEPGVPPCSWPTTANLTRVSLTLRPVDALETVDVIPPFERFYESNRDAVFALLARRLGRAAAEDAFQETFLKALRAYGRLEHGRHLRAWVLTIAERVALDELRRARPTAEPVEGTHVDGRPAYEELDDLAGDLPPKERAAVVLRYGYDLAYDEIGEALGSSSEAARQAASSGVRRLRKKELP